MITGWEIVIALAALAIAIAALWPFVPYWAWYAFAVAYELTRVLAILEHGMSTKRVVGVITPIPILILGWIVLRRQQKQGDKS